MHYMKNLDTNHYKDKQNRGFVQIILLIVIVLFIMQYYGITLRGIWYWFRDLFLSVW